MANLGALRFVMLPAITPSAAPPNAPMIAPVHALCAREALPWPVLDSIRLIVDRAMPTG